MADFERLASPPGSAASRLAGAGRIA